MPYMRFERDVLKVWYTVVFTLVLAQIGVMLAGLLCSNHVTYRFEKGMMPEQYRLNEGIMKVIWESYAVQIADQYGADVADDILKRVNSPFASNSSLLGGVPSMGYNTIKNQNTTYNSISMPVPSSPTSPVTPTQNHNMPTLTHYSDGGMGMGMPGPMHSDQEYDVGSFREHMGGNRDEIHSPLAPYHANYNSLGAGEDHR